MLSQPERLPTARPVSVLGNSSKADADDAKPIAPVKWSAT
jgi:hypothetical protein